MGRGRGDRVCGGLQVHEYLIERESELKKKQCEY